MIDSKVKLKEYMERDRKALNIHIKKPKMFGNEIWKFQIYLRKIEYFMNCKTGIMNKFILKYYKFRFYQLGIKLNFYITPNVFDKGLSIAHVGPIIVNDYAKIGENCRIHVGVNIGATLDKPKDAPIIGNNVYIGPGAKIYGKIKIGNNVAIGANAVVNKDVPDNVTVAGVPAKIVSNKGNIRKISN